MVALLTSVRNSPCFSGLRRTKTCHWQLFARPSMLFGCFLHDAKSDNPFPCREIRGFLNLESAHPNNNFPLTKLNPFAASRLLRRPRRHFLLLSQQIFALRAIIGGCAAFLCCLRHPSGGYAAFSVACGNNSCRFAAFRHSRLWHTPWAYHRGSTNLGFARRDCDE